MLHAARWKYRTQKNCHFGAIAQLCWAISSELGHVSTIGKNLLNSSTSSTFPDNMVNFGLLTAEISWRVWGTPANSNRFRVLAALLHGTLVVGVCQTLHHWTEGAAYIRQGGRHVGHWPTFLVVYVSDIPKLFSITFTFRTQAEIPHFQQPIRLRFGIWKRWRRTIGVHLHVRFTLFSPLNIFV